MRTKHQGSMCGTGDQDGLILDAPKIVTSTEDLALHDKAPREALGLNLQRLCLRKTHWFQFQKAPEAEITWECLKPLLSYPLILEVCEVPCHVGLQHCHLLGT